MIPDIEIKKLTDKLSSENIFKFFKKNATKSVYFHHQAESDNLITINSLEELESSPLKVPTLQIEDDVFLVVHNNQALSQTLAKDSFQVATIMTNKLTQLADHLEGVNGIAVQAKNCYFTIDLQELKEGLELS